VDDLTVDRHRLRDLVARHAGSDELTAARVPGLTLHQRWAPTPLHDAVFQPSLSLVVQGRKRTILGRHDLRYGTDRYLITPVEVPVVTQVLEASVHTPFLSLMVRLDPALVAEVLAGGGLRTAPPTVTGEEPTGTVDDDLARAILRTVRLLDAPQDIPVLAPLALRELVYRLAIADRSHRLRWPSTDSAGPGARIARAMSWLKANYAESVQVSELAAQVNMSTSSLHEHFRAVTGMTPLQYQKALRLGEARRLMVVDSFDAATAAHTVGYASPTQFSREYRRLYGRSPYRDAQVLRGVVAAPPASTELQHML
jgi:AraC-like DNA-binding protein